MSVDILLFGFTAFLVIASALMVIVNRHPVHSALFLVLTFLGLAGFYLQLNAPFIAAVQVIVYAGAIMVLFVFVIMLLGVDPESSGEKHLGISPWLGATFALGLLLELGFLVTRPLQAGEGSTLPYIKTIASAGETGQTVPFGSIKAVGNTLFTQYVFAFEATSVVLLIAMIGIVVLAKRRL